LLFEVKEEMSSWEFLGNKSQQYGKLGNFVSNFPPRFISQDRRLCSSSFKELETIKIYRNQTIYKCNFIVVICYKVWVTFKNVAYDGHIGLELQVIFSI
jgi:hypothetical protein